MKKKVWDKEILKEATSIFKDKSQREVWDILRSIFETGKILKQNTNTSIKWNWIDDIPF
jgi:hypothetical protein